MRISKPLATLIFLALLATLLGVFKFSSCEGNGWATPAQYIQACYSDIPALYGERDLDKDQWSYSSTTDAVEYPVLTGTVMWIFALATPAGENEIRTYYRINIAFLAALFILIAIIVYRIRPEFAYLTTLAPAAVGSLYINWDLWAIISMMLSIYWFDRKKYKHSAIAIGVSISTKFLPVFLLLPIVLILWRRNEVKELIRYIAITVLTFATINLPVLLTTPEGWLRFYELNFDRGQDWGSLWYALTSLGVNLGNTNFFAILALFVSVLFVSLLIFSTKNVITLADVSFIVLALVMIASKVYSPQYILWLVPLAVIAMSTRKDLHAFWIWQIAEVIYHVAIWQHLATVTGAKFGLPLGGYALITLIRILACLYFLGVLVKKQAKGGQFPHEFLFKSADSYP
ncbi:MAG: mannosyltransferase [Actinobacteria bacterium]|nr:mannosyltransferase [Actinomycetota bacterium]